MQLRRHAPAAAGCVLWLTSATASRFAGKTPYFRRKGRRAPFPWHPLASDSPQPTRKGEASHAQVLRWRHLCLQRSRRRRVAPRRWLAVLQQSCKHGAPPISSPPERGSRPTPPDAAPGPEKTVGGVAEGYQEAYGDPTQLKDATFTQVKGKKLVQRLIISDFLKTELNLGQLTGHLKRLPEGELLAVQNSTSGYYAKDDRPGLVLSPYDEDKGVQWILVPLEPEAGSTSACLSRATSATSSCCPRRRNNPEPARLRRDARPPPGAGVFFCPGRGGTRSRGCGAAAAGR